MRDQAGAIEKLTLDKIWEDDLLDRRTDAETILRFLERRVEERRTLGQTASFVLNIDSAWGNGKTFFLERFQKHIELEGHQAAYVNAWESDHAPDPLIAVISQINDSFEVMNAEGDAQKEAKGALRGKWDVAKKAAGPVAIAVLKGGAKSFLTRYLGSEVGDVIKEHLKSEDAVEEEAKADDKMVDGVIGNAVSGAVDVFLDGALAEHKASKESIEGFRAALGQLMEGQFASADKQKLLFVLVDELDRCRPTYAIEMLETIKHLFNAENVVFVVATDADQLVKAISAVYGNDFGANRYLQRFFHQKYTLGVSERNSVKLVSELCIPKFTPYSDILAWPTGLDLRNLLVEMRFLFRSDVREFLGVIDHVLNFLSTWPFGNMKVHIVYVFYLVYCQRRSSVDDIHSLASSDLDIDSVFRCKILNIINGTLNSLDYDLMTELNGLRFKIVSNERISGRQILVDEGVDASVVDFLAELRDEEVFLSSPYKDRIMSGKECILNFYPSVVEKAGNFSN